MYEFIYNTKLCVSSHVACMEELQGTVGVSMSNVFATAINIVSDCLSTTLEEQLGSQQMVTEEI